MVFRRPSQRPTFFSYSSFIILLPIGVGIEAAFEDLDESLPELLVEDGVDEGVEGGVDVPQPHDEVHPAPGGDALLRGEK